MLANLYANLAFSGLNFDLKLILKVSKSLRNLSDFFKLGLVGLIRDLLGSEGVRGKEQKGCHFFLKTDAYVTFVCKNLIFKVFKLNL